MTKQNLPLTILSTVRTARRMGIPIPVYAGDLTYMYTVYPDGRVERETR